MNLKKAIYWPFRSLANFTIASLGVVGLSFWGYSIYSEGKFNQPIIGESVKLLGKHLQVRELVGTQRCTKDIPSFIPSRLAIVSSKKRINHIFRLR